MIPTQDEVWKELLKSRSFEKHSKRGGFLGWFYQKLGEVYADPQYFDYPDFGDFVWEELKLVLPKKYWGPDAGLCYGMIPKMIDKAILETLKKRKPQPDPPELIESKMKMVSECQAVIAEMKIKEKPILPRRFVKA